MKACPYCDGEGQVRTEVGRVVYYVVVCLICLARGPVQHTRAAAIEAWDTRRDDER